MWHIIFLQCRRRKKHLESLGEIFPWHIAVILSHQSVATHRVGQVQMIVEVCRGILLRPSCCQKKIIVLVFGGRRKSKFWSQIVSPQQSTGVCDVWAIRRICHRLECGLENELFMMNILMWGGRVPESAWTEHCCRGAHGVCWADSMPVGAPAHRKAGFLQCICCELRLWILTESSCGTICLQNQSRIRGRCPSKLSRDSGAVISTG